MDKHYTRFCDLVAVSSLVGCLISGRADGISKTGAGSAAAASGGAGSSSVQKPWELCVSGRCDVGGSDESVSLRQLSGPGEVQLHAGTDSAVS